VGNIKVNLQPMDAAGFMWRRLPSSRSDSLSPALVHIQGATLLPWLWEGCPSGSGDPAPHELENHLGSGRKGRDNGSNHRGCRMKRMKASFLFLSLLAVCALLILAGRIIAQTTQSNIEPSAKTQAVPKASAEKSAVVGYLHTRDKVVAISRGAEGPIYTVKTKDGKLLASDLNEKDFEEKYPTLFNQVKYGLAGNDASLRKQAIPVLLTPSR
jgi:hypothetical protein